MKFIIFNYCFNNKTDIITTDNIKIIEFVKIERNTNTDRELIRIINNYFNSLLKSNFLIFINNQYKLKYYNIINDIINIYKNKIEVDIKYIEKTILEKYKDDKILYIIKIINKVLLENNIIYENDKDKYMYFFYLLLSFLYLLYDLSSYSLDFSLYSLSS